MPDFFVSLLGDLSDTFFDPKKRIFIGYLLSAVVVACVWMLVIQRKAFADLKQAVFSREVWFSASAITDYYLLFFNKVIMMLISPLLLGQLVIATFLFESFHHMMLPKPFEHWGSVVVMPLFTLVLFLLDDASRYLLHRWLHHSPTLWRFHQVHHTATHLTPFTIFRTHPIEGVLFSLRSALVQGFCIGSFVFLFGSGVDLVTIFGVNILLFIFNITGANLRHSPVSIPYPKKVERWLISPAQHQLHHSTDPQHFNKNYGVILAVWDRLGGTFLNSESERVLDYGILRGGEKIQEPLWCVYMRPFQENWCRLVKKGKVLIRDAGTPPAP